MLEILGNLWNNIQSYNLQDLLSTYGYYAILLITFFEGESIVILAGITASRGLLDPKLVALCAFIGSMTSDQIMFSLGKYKGSAMLRRFPRLSTNMDKAGSLIKKYDTLIIVGFRFIYGVRNITPIMLGIWGERHLKFLLLNLLGALIWAISFTAVGFYGSKGILKIKEHLSNQAFYLLGGIILLSLGFWLIRSRRLKKRNDQCLSEQAKEEKDISQEQKENK